MESSLPAIRATVLTTLTTANDWLWKNEVPTLVRSVSAATQRLALPASLDAAFGLTIAEKLRLAPALGIAIAFVVTGLDTLSILIRHEQQIERTYWLTRLVLMRMVGLVYAAAFATACHQMRPMYGLHGLMPHPRQPIRPSPAFETLLWMTGDTAVKDWMLEAVSWTGFVVAGCVVWKPVRNCLWPLVLWVLYLSLINLGSGIINYGWEWLTVELGFLTIFLAPPFWTRQQHDPPPLAIIWLYRWCAFRLLIGAGMSKVGTNSSDCWSELSCTETHYVTQPMPSPLAWYAHHVSQRFHRFEIALTFFEQLVLPFLLIAPVRWLSSVAGVMEILFQLAVVATGNYAWINWVGIIPCLALFDDQTLESIFPSWVCPAIPSEPQQPKESSPRKLITRSRVRTLLSGLLVTFIGVKSIAPLQELFSPSPWLHYYDDYFFVNSQGVFGFINQRRAQPVLWYTHSTIDLPSQCVDVEPTPFASNGGRAMMCAELGPHCGHPQHGQAIRSACPRTCGFCAAKALSKSGIRWEAMHFKNLPGDVHQRPYFNSPFHYRLDWEVWIRTTASMDSSSGSYHAVPEPLSTLISHILSGDTDAVSLVRDDPGILRVDNTTKKLSPPTAIRLQYYWYNFSHPSANSSAWWARKRLGAPMLFVGQLQRTEHRQWPSIGPSVFDTVFRTQSAPFLARRQWVLSLAASGFVATVGDQPSTRTGVVLVACFSSAFVADYPTLVGSFESKSVSISWTAYCAAFSSLWVLATAFRTSDTRATRFAYFCLLAIFVCTLV